MGPFTGWPDEALDFYEGLEADNSKAYWDPRKPVYERAVKAPMEALLAELEAEFGPFKIMRPYRDVRFSADKTPYKTFIGAGSPSPAGVYVAFSAGGLYAGAGIWHLSRDQLLRYRAAVDGAPGDELERIEADLSAAGFELGGETLKRAPKGWAADHRRIELLRHTSVLVGRSYPPESWMATPEAEERVLAVWRVARPVTAWLDTYVGAAEEPIRR
ncbi:MAG: hypothetical protein QOK39_1733 [Acidimicrobiaceae bacterium]|nr:hypothetical protein [Acidimicrobiaceae bacterium]